MGEIIQFNRKIIESETVRHDTGSLSEQETSKVEQIRDSIETALETVAQKENMPLTVAMAAGRYSAMRMFQIQGRAETMAFLDQCIVTAELCDDLTKLMDEDA